MSAKNNLNIKHNILIPVGVLTYNNSIALLEASVSDAGFYFAWSKTGEYFEPAEISKEKRVTFKNGLRIHLPSECRDFRFALVEKKYLVTYVRTYKSKKYRITAYSKNLYDWNVVSEVEFQGRESVIASETLVKGQYLMYESEVFVSALTSTDFKKWDDNNEYVFTSRAGMFDDGLLKVMGAFSTDRGIALIYESINDHDEMYNISVGGAIFSFDNPRKILWRSETALWKSEGRFPESTNHSIIGAVPQDDDILLYWVTAQGELLIGRVKPIGKVKHQLRPDRVTLTRHVANPVLSPEIGRAHV